MPAKKTTAEKTKPKTPAAMKKKTTAAAKPRTGQTAKKPSSRPGQLQPGGARKQPRLKMPGTERRQREAKERGRGRPDKLTDEVQARILRAAKNGNFLETCAALAGLSPDALRKYIRKGRQGKSGKYARFVRMLDQALAHAEANSVRDVRKAGKGDWRAAMAYLEKGPSRDRWGRVTVEVDGKVKHTGDVNHHHDGTVNEGKIIISDPILAAKAADLIAAVAAGPANAGGTGVGDKRTEVVLPTASGSAESEAD